MLKWISIICVSAYLGGCKQRPENSDSETLTASSINNTSLLREGDEMQCSIAELGAENVSRCEDIANDFARSSELRSINFLISCGGELFDVQIERSGHNGVIGECSTTMPDQLALDLVEFFWIVIRQPNVNHFPKLYGFYH